MENGARGSEVTATNLSDGCYLLECDSEHNSMDGLYVWGMGFTPTIVKNMRSEGCPAASGDHPNKHDVMV